ncbi:response regulator [Desulfobacter latus]|uniref:Two-component system response regulator n=1 Tax=Desulfobacter latus TaxID=2292 RepID=A0A850T2Y1_9BACT|nr:two-component system response regulator [Desulfobacter latus]NWH06093.1 two-component system response regulator [Desulfobacter latus]
MTDLSQMRVLIVDDVKINVDILVEALGDDYRISVAMDGESALKIVEQTPPDIILLDIMMPGIDGYEVCERLKSKTATRDIPVVFLTALSDEDNEAKGLALGAVDYITKPFSPAIVKARVKNHLELKQHKDHLENLVAKRTRELLLTQEISMECIGTLAEFRDPDTGGHIKRTQYYIKTLADQLKILPQFKEILNEETIDRIYKCAPLHDIGKVAIPDAILHKPGKLTKEEFDVMKTHTTHGYKVLLSGIKRLDTGAYLKCAAEIALTHHEKWDGSGYPQGLSGDNIPVEGRLMAIADVYDALVSKRVYKPPFPHSQAMAYILKGRGQHFDPDMVDVFKQHAEVFRAIAIEFADHHDEIKTLQC